MTLGVVVHDAGERTRACGGEDVLDLRVQRALIALETQHIVAALLNDLIGDLGPAAHRVNRHDAARELEQLQPLGEYSVSPPFLRAGPVGVLRYPPATARAAPAALDGVVG
jgi:hypothetical protein